MKLKVGIQTQYLEKIYDNKSFIKTVNATVKAVQKLHKKSKIQAIAFTGTSGAAVAYPVSYLTGIPLICVRKSIKDNHYRKKVEGVVNHKNYAIIDDMICSGSTVKKIINAVKKEDPQSKLTHIVLYAGHSDSGYSEKFDCNIVNLNSNY